MILPDVAILFEWDAQEKWWSHRDTKVSKGDDGFTRRDDPLEWLSSGSQDEDSDEDSYDPLGTPGRLVVGWTLFRGLFVLGFTAPKDVGSWFSADLPIGDGLLEFFKQKGQVGLLYFTGCYGDAQKQVVEVLSSFIGATLTLPD